MEGDDEAFDGAPMGNEEMFSNGGDIDDPRQKPPSTLGKAGASGGGDLMDVEAYAALYTGRTKVVRLLFIAKRCGNEAMQLEALRMAHDEIKKGEDTPLYREVTERIGDRLGPQYALDQTWADIVDRRAEHRKEKLENEFNSYKVPCLGPLILVCLFITVEESTSAVSDFEFHVIFCEVSVHFTNPYTYRMVQYFLMITPKRNDP